MVGQWSVGKRMDSPANGTSATGSPADERLANFGGSGPGCVMNAMSRMSPPLPGHATTGNSFPTRAMGGWHLFAPFARLVPAHARFVTFQGKFFDTQK